MLNRAFEFRFLVPKREDKNCRATDSSGKKQEVRHICKVAGRLSLFAVVLVTIHFVGTLLYGSIILIHARTERWIVWIEYRPLLNYGLP